MSSERAAFAATRVRAMFSSLLAAIPIDGICVFWFYTMTSPLPRFIDELRGFAYSWELRRWGQTGDGVGRFDEHYRCGMIWFAPSSRHTDTGTQQVKISLTGKKGGRGRDTRRARMVGRLPAQLPHLERLRIQDYFIEDLVTFFDSDDPSLHGANDGCVVAVVEYSQPEQTGPGPVQQLVRTALQGPYESWEGDGPRKRWLSNGLAVSTDWFIKK